MDIDLYVLVIHIVYCFIGLCYSVNNHGLFGYKYGYSIIAFGYNFITLFITLIRFGIFLLTFVYNGYLVGIEAITQPILQLQFAAMWFMNVAFFNRPCDLTYYGPFMYDIELPTNDKEWDNDNMPQFIQIAFCESKGDLTGRPYKQLLKRNYVNPRYCPVMRLLAYMFFSGMNMQSRSRLFMRLDKFGMIPIHDGGECIPIKKEGKNILLQRSTAGNAMHISSSYYLQTHSIVFTVGSHHCPNTPEGAELANILTSVTCYSDRKSGVKWAARSRATNAQVKATGHWCENSTEYQKYMEEGMTKEECLDVRGGTDEILLVWTYKPTTFAQLNSGEFRRRSHVGLKRNLATMLDDEDDED